MKLQATDTVQQILNLEAKLTLCALQNVQKTTKYTDMTKFPLHTTVCVGYVGVSCLTILYVSKDTQYLVHIMEPFNALNSTVVLKM